MTKNSIVRDEKIKPFKQKSQKRQRRMFIVVLLIIIAAGIGGYFLFVPREDTYTIYSYETSVVAEGTMRQIVQGSGTVSIPVAMTVTNDSAGYARDLYVDEGDSVVEGEVLAVLNVPDLYEDLEDLQTDLADMKTNLETLKIQNTISQNRSQRSIYSLDKDIADAREELEKYEELAKVSASRQSDVESAQKTLESLLDDKEEKELQLEEDIILDDLSEAQKEADIAKTRTQINRLLADINKATIISPFTGLVQRVEDTLSVPGSSVKAGTSLFTIVDPDSAVIELEISESYAGYIKVGQIVALNASGLDFTGTVKKVGTVAEISSGSVEATIQVIITPDPSAGQLLEGVTAVGEFEIGAKENTLIIPRGSYLTTGSQKYVYVVKGGKAVKTPVTYGTIQATEVEIVSGLKPGDTIITSGYQNFIQYDEVILGNE